MRAIKFNRFSEIEKMYCGTRYQCLRDFPNLVSHVEEMIRFQYWFNEEVYSVLEENMEEVDKKYGNRIAITNRLFSRNTQLIYSAYKNNLDGITTASYNLLRTVYESVLTQYYIGLYKDDDLTIYIKKILSESFKTKKYEHNFLKQQLYDEKMQVVIGGFYKRINSFVHPDATSLIDAKYSKKYVEDCFLMMSTLSLFNVLSYIQIFYDGRRYVEHIIDELESFINEVLVKYEYKIVHFFPNKDELIKKLVWGPNSSNPEFDNT